MPSDRDTLRDHRRRLEAIDRSLRLHDSQIAELLGGGGGGAVDSVFGRTGAVVAAPGDYAAADIIAGEFADARISASSVLQHQASFDHGSIAGLADDDHTQYHNDARGDARYYTQSLVDAGDAATLASALAADPTSLTDLDTTVTGAELDADHAKLAGIEAGATADQTPAEILAAMLTVDGAGSGLDADLLDGLSSAAFLRPGDIDTLAELNAIVADATLIDTGDSRLSDARAPTAHASTHVNGTDDIQNATASVKGLATAAQIAKLDGIEAGAQVTNQARVDAAGAVMWPDFPSANQIAVRDRSGAESYPVIGTSQVLGRTASPTESTKGLTAAEQRTILNVENGAQVVTQARVEAGIAAGLITTKGDRIQGNVVGVPVRRAVGANGTMLIADSTVSDGLRDAYRIQSVNVLDATDVENRVDEVNFDRSHTIAANTMAAGRFLRVTASGGLWTSLGSASTFIFRLKLGSTAIYVSGTVNVASGVTGTWRFQWTGICRTGGSSGDIDLNVNYGFTHTTFTTNHKQSTLTGSIDWTASQVVQVSVQMGTAASGIKANLEQLHVEVFG